MVGAGPGPAPVPGRAGLGGAGRPRRRLVFCTSWCIFVHVRYIWTSYTLDGYIQKGKSKKLNLPFLDLPFCGSLNMRGHTVPKCQVCYKKTAMTKCQVCYKKTAMISTLDMFKYRAICFHVFRYICHRVCISLRVSPFGFGIPPLLIRCCHM